MFEHTANGGQAEFLIVMVDQADLNGAAALRTKPEKTGFVRDALWKKARATQCPALHWLREQKIEHRPYYLVNLIWAKAGLDVAQVLAARPEVARIEGNPEIRQNLLQPALESWADGPSADKIETPASIEPGISYTRAPEVWALGYTGQGIVIGAVDTGVRWEHNALKNKYRVNTTDARSDVQRLAFKPIPASVFRVIARSLHIVETGGLTREIVRCGHAFSDVRIVQIFSNEYR